MLSGVLTFKSICTQSNTLQRAKIKLQLISDCKTLVNKVNNILRNRRTTNQHRDSDVDLELQLLYELQSLISNNTTISITHVRSHQELKKVQSALSHAEFLNSIADNLTKTARVHRRKSTYISLPQNPIDFTIHNIPINSKYALRSKKAYHSIYLRTYLKDKHNWSNKTIDSIWWKIYYNSLSKLSSPEKVIIYKFIHNRLPTKARDQKYYSFRNKACDHCQCDHENEDHILQCHSAKRKLCRDVWLNEINDYLSQNHTPMEVKQLITTNLHQWLESISITDTYDELSNPETNKASKQQFNIGWKHFLRGRLTIEWGYIIQQHLDKEKIHNMNAEKWGSDLLAIHWKHILKIWKERCEDLHVTTTEQIETNKKLRLYEEICNIQSTNQNLAHTEHAWVLADTSQFQNYTSTNLQTWIYNAKIITGLNQQKLKLQRQRNITTKIWNRAKLKPTAQLIEKGDLDPGESSLRTTSDC
jgi:hypothetical protein